MAYHRTIFRQMLQLVSRLEFQSIVKRHKGDYRCRKLQCWDQFIHLLFGQFGKRESLRDTVSTTGSMSSKLYHLGCRALCRSTLSDANNRRPNEIYRDLFFTLLQRVQNIAPQYKLKLPRKLFIMDSTLIELCLKLFPWARYQKTVSAIKLHTGLQADGAIPTFLHISDGKRNDIMVAKKLPIARGSFVVFDRGYDCLHLYKSYTDNDIRFVTRMKKDAKLRIIDVHSGARDDGVIADETVEYVHYYSKKDYPHRLRRIRYHDSDSKKKLTFVTNDFQLDAKTIADIYKARWEIELFFRTIKQNLKIKRFIGTSKNAVLTQVWIAMIAYLITSYYKFQFRSKLSIQTLIRIIQVNLFERKSLSTLFGLPDPNDSNCYGQHQYAFF